MNVIDKILERASSFVELVDNVDREMLKVAIVNSNVDVEKLLVFNDTNFMHDIIGLMKHFNFTTMSCDHMFVPISSR